MKLKCSRCQKSGPALAAEPPLPGDLAAEVVLNVCQNCWREWEDQEVKVINELRLNFMDPEAAEILQRQLREFLVLPSATAEES